MWRRRGSTLRLYEAECKGLMEKYTCETDFTKDKAAGDGIAQ